MGAVRKLPPVLAYHLAFRAWDGAPIAREPGARRVLARTVTRIGDAYGLLAFRSAGDHVHVLLATDHPGRAAQAIASGLAQRLQVVGGFSGAWQEPVREQRHLESAFRYVLRNSTKHATRGDAMHEASAVQELLGLRLGGTGLVRRVRSMLPGIDRAVLLQALEVASLDEHVEGAWLADAAAGAVGAVSLDQAGREVTRARAAAARVAGDLAAAEAGALLGWSERSVYRARAAAGTPSLEKAIRLRMGLRKALGVRWELDTPIGHLPPAEPVGRVGWWPGR